MARRLRNRAARYVRDAAFFRGAVRRQRGWKRVFRLLVLTRFLRQHVGHHPEGLASERLRIGESITITTLGPSPTRRQRRRTRRRAAARR